MLCARTFAIATTSTTTATTAWLAGGRWRSCDCWSFFGRTFSWRCNCTRCAWLGQIYFELAVVHLVRHENSAMRSFLHEAGELGHAEVLLIERAVDLLHDLLEAVGAHYVAVALHALHRFTRELPRVPLGDVFLTGVDQSGECVVAVVLVAILDQQIAG